MIKIAHQEIFNSVNEYCERYNIPIEHLVDILQDQKVLPMIRGKATEYLATVVLKKSLGRNWQVQKLNLNAQPGTHDEDISITHTKTGARLKVEAKNAVRGSFRIGNMRTIIKEPHFKVKCHKSRSHIKKSATTNDRYMVGDFDLIVCNVSNAIFQGGTWEDDLKLLDNADATRYLKDYYAVQDDASIIRQSYDDWRVCFPRFIAMADKSIPRTPYVQMVNDKNWFQMQELEEKLLPELKHIKGQAGRGAIPG